MYFQLKDADAAVSAVMFRSDNRRLRFTPEDGMDVLLEGRISLYEPRGQFQLIASHMEPLGLGSLYLALEQLKARLAAEGLFDEKRKRPLPLLPGRIGIATSPTGAAIRDMLRVLERRFAGVPVLVAPCRVQGHGAAAEIATALDRLNRHGVDVILLGRGGGSVEDLWAFNEEEVARAIAASAAPVICGVGHEIDVTLADLVADRRAATPSAAAEIAMQSKLELAGRIAAQERRVATAARLAVAGARRRLERLRSSSGFQGVPRRLQDASQHLDDLASRAGAALQRRRLALVGALDLLKERLSPRALAGRVAQRRARMENRKHMLRAAIRATMEARHGEVRRLADLLESFSPLAVLSRGYAICRDARGRVVLRSSQVVAGEDVQVRLHRGSLDCRVTRRHPAAAEEA
jgi:exodeoxyribonuclease VII large subunit